MIFSLITVAFIIITCVFLNSASGKVGVPVLLAFMIFGIIAGNNSLMHMDFHDLESAENIATIALIFIMFYGGFGTRWESAKAVAREAGILATLGVVLTALLTGLFCHFAFKWGWIESFLMGSVVSSTDAASVFSILRSRKLGLKNNTAPLLEVESGSNDPMSNILTIVFLTMLTEKVSVGHVSWMLFDQMAFGAGLGLAIASGAVYAMRRLKFSSGFDSLFLVATALLAYAIPGIVGGNGYLSAYMVGIVMGNSGSIGNKKEQVAFFDGFTGLMQMCIFFMLGLLVDFREINHVLLPSVLIFLFMLIVARPASVAAILCPFKKYPFKQQALISFSGLRGAASIVFAIMVTVGKGSLSFDILNVVFCIVLISISFQGFLIPVAAKRLDMTDDNDDVMKTFSDFSEETPVQFTEAIIREGNPWVGKIIKELGIPKDLLFCMIIRDDGKHIIPNGNTKIEDGDHIIICSTAYTGEESLKVLQHKIMEGSPWIGKKLREYPASKNQVLMIQRGSKTIIPHGDTILEKSDVLYINQA